MSGKLWTCWICFGFALVAFLLDRAQPGYMKFYGEVQLMGFLQKPLEDWKDSIQEIQQIQKTENSRCRATKTNLDKFLQGTGEKCL
jgi:hypothetical protein